ncbi:MULTISPECIES: menaquinol-cytochrome c reductase iron-sulfur subunit [Bacillus]|uniref:Menaquinol:cytochrome c reductase iron-sulfur subunit n=2 Tax=Bacillus cereus TaxID=1396 RepID=A0A2B2GFM6_BACCE|nr:MULTISPECIES: menaquinol-cytochrome c reductase iron-sulfur subunit [Bacillus]EJS67288.1 menaquinol-cytochrome c reductase iron-sulfur subunit [Bacillus cereus BAG2X1-1]EJQ77659.1 menaquinol-cytochrome c reductase iron-sulfur subunit [Bacillus cereus HuA4-10]EJS75120.1 menaquinol-cytochrome c reductase iron-sulfur subunit [Bacillus cereus BAG2X1-3]MDM5238392.1 menaquinol-cytochrome c reductase iron-sulfur subunit [Bacillus cereus]MDR4985414.1 menaquinol-cytochrome c reductase iron-sulfur su
MSEKEHRVSRRQFLNYTLTGVGGFMAAGILMPMTRFALDPVLRKEAGTDMVAVAQVKDITTEPKRFDFKVKQVDGWYKSDEPKSAWVHKDESGDIVAFSPVCKHLGCTVNWNSDKAHPNQFFCPCHGGRYTKDGVNIKGTPPLAPLDVYESKVKDGTLYLGKAKPRGGAK